MLFFDNMARKLYEIAWYTTDRNGARIVERSLWYGESERDALATFQDRMHVEESDVLAVIPKDGGPGK